MACIPYLTHQRDKNWVNKGKTSKRHAEGKHQCLRIGIMHQLYFKPPGYGVVGCLGVITDRSPLVIGCHLVAGHLFLLRIRYSHSSARESQEFLCPQSLECFKDLFWSSLVLPGVWPPYLSFTFFYSAAQVYRASPNLDHSCWDLMHSLNVILTGYPNQPVKTYIICLSHTTTPLHITCAPQTWYFQTIM